MPMNFNSLFLLFCCFSLQLLGQEDSLAYTQYVYKLSGEKIKFRLYNPESPTGLTFINLHDNENSCVQATLKLIRQSKDKFIEIKFKGKRWLNGINPQSGKKFIFDPNRIFTDFGCFQTLKMYFAYNSYNKMELLKLSSFITDSLLKNTNFVIAVHNNTALHIEKYIPDSIFQDNAAEIFVNPEHNAHNFFYVLEKEHFENMMNLGYNVLIQNPTEVKDDGSLSVYCAQKNIPYVNVEAKEGESEFQYKMLFDLRNTIPTINPQKNEKN